MRPLIIYHGNCYDGFGAAFAAWLKFGDGADYVPANYGDDPPDVAGREVYIVDFSWDRYTMEQMFHAAASLVVLDHHKTAEESLRGLNFATFDMNHSGAVLAWLYFWKKSDPDGSVPPFFAYIEDRDLWKFELPESREFTYGLRSYPMDFKVWSGLHNRDATIIERGRGVRGYCEQLVEILAAEAREGEIAGQRMWIVNATALFSEVCEALVKRGPWPVAAAYRDTATMRVWGLRSAPEFDCSVLAEAMGGGGHKCAAGFTEPLAEAVGGK